jgi:hypothetical protein
MVSIFQVYQQEGNTVDDGFANLFSSCQSMPLKRLKLRNARLSNEGLKQLLRTHRLTELELHRCRQLTEDCLEALNAASEQLLSLTIGEHSSVLPRSMHVTSTNFVPYESRGYVLKAPRLRRLCVRSMVRQTSI